MAIIVKDFCFNAKLEKSKLSASMTFFPSIHSSRNPLVAHFKNSNDAMFVMCCLLIEKDCRVRWNISILLPCVFVCLSTVNSSIFGKSFQFPFPYFVWIYFCYRKEDAHIRLESSKAKESKSTKPKGKIEEKKKNENKTDHGGHKDKVDNESKFENYFNFNIPVKFIKPHQVCFNFFL